MPLLHGVMLKSAKGMMIWLFQTPSGEARDSITHPGGVFTRSAPGMRDDTYGYNFGAT
jgi:hypothetical protein